ncbi:MAG: hypothetical protein ACON5F_07330 [Jejuia sp.]
MTIKDWIFYILVFLNIAFVVFVFVSRYLTRHEEHHHVDEDEGSVDAEE